MDDQTVQGLDLEEVEKLVREWLALPFLPDSPPSIAANLRYEQCAILRVMEVMCDGRSDSFRSGY